MKINILGQEYEIVKQTEKENVKLYDADGLCETFAKKIILNDFEETNQTLEKCDLYKNKVLRHEIIHAFLHESGLDMNSDWAGTKKW